ADVLDHKYMVRCRRRPALPLQPGEHVAAGAYQNVGESNRPALHEIDQKLCFIRKRMIVGLQRPAGGTMHLHYQRRASETELLSLSNETEETEPFVIVEMDKVVRLVEGNQMTEQSVRPFLIRIRCPDIILHVREHDPNSVIGI